MRLHTAADVIALGHMGDVYLYHQRYGYILQMSPDVHQLWAAFEGGAEAEVVEAAFAQMLDGQAPAELITVLREFRCLHGSQEDGDAWLDTVPVKGAWNVWSSRGLDVTLWTAWGDRPVSRVEIGGVDAAIWRSIDGETTVRRLINEHGDAPVRALLPRLSAIETQAIKLSPVPLSVYGGRRNWPAYLVSTMPYRRLSVGGETEADLGAYHRGIADADHQFDHLETTLAHLLRRPHPALGGRPFGAALLGGLERHGLALGDKLQVLEIGGGLGEVAGAIVDAIRARGFEVDYTICELSETLAARQRERTVGMPVTVIVGDALAVELPACAFDLVIANEMIGDLPVSPLETYRRPDQGSRPRRPDQGSRFELDFEDAPPNAVLNTGAFALLERAARWLRAGGIGMFSEFGERSVFPRLSTHLDHREHSIHFGHLEAVASSLELKPVLTYLIDLIDMRRDLEGLSTTRSQFRALTAMLGEHGLTIEKIGYTREMFTELTAVLPPETMGDIRFDRIEDRLMGLVPHEFKALIIHR